MYEFNCKDFKDLLDMKELVGFLEVEKHLN